MPQLIVDYTEAKSARAKLLAATDGARTAKEGTHLEPPVEE